MSQSSLTRQELKLEIIEFLKLQPQTRYENIISGIEQHRKHKLSSSENQDLLEIIHEFITSNILMTAANHYNAGWPCLGLTKHGKRLLHNAGPPVYDYEGYLADLLRRVPDLDEVVKLYVAESLRTYQTNSFLASMAMLGCASEKAIKLLIDAYVAAIDSQDAQNKLRSRLNKREISVAYEEFKRSFEATKNQIASQSIVRDFDAHVEAVFGFIRLLRNSIVHPSAVPNITSALIYANLQQFSYYIETIFGLISYYHDHTITV